MIIQASRSSGVLILRYLSDVPKPPEEHQQRHRGRDVQPDDEREVRRLRRRDVQVAGPLPAEQGRQEDAVSQARDREQFGHALQRPDDDRFGVRQLVHAADPGPSTLRIG
jgi:hypothetical protein